MRDVLQVLKADRGALTALDDGAECPQATSGRGEVEGLPDLLHLRHTNNEEKFLRSSAKLCSYTSNLLILLTLLMNRTPLCPCGALGLCNGLPTYNLVCTRVRC